ncbi:MAG: GPP34 family phosphoprotein [Micromonosporaceae bacterium]
MTGPRHFWLLADRYWALAHDEYSGRARLHPGALGLGLAGCLLGELVVASWLRVAGGGLHHGPYEGVPAEPLQRSLYQLVCREADGQPLDLWLRALAPQTADWVASRAEAQGLCRREPRRVGLLRRPAWQIRPVDATTAAYVSVVLRTGIASPHLMDQDDITLLGMAMATELAGPVVLWDDEQPPQAVPQLLARLEHGLGALIAHTEAVIGHAVMTH